MKPSMIFDVVSLTKHQNCLHTEINLSLALHMLDIHMTSDREHYRLIEVKCLLNQPFPGSKKDHCH